MASSFLLSRGPLQALRLSRRLDSVHRCFQRGISVTSVKAKGLVLGVYEPEEKDGPLSLSAAAEFFDKQNGGKLRQLLPRAGRKLKPGQSRLLYGMSGDDTVAVVNIGKKSAGYSEIEVVDEKRENIRAACARGVLQLRDAGETEVSIDPCEDAEAAAEGSRLALFSYDDLKDEEKHKPDVTLTAYMDHPCERPVIEKGWASGSSLADGQNFARMLMEAPSNVMTPTKFAETVQSRLAGRCSVIIREEAWAENMNMGAFMAVGLGSAEPSCFLELDYRGSGNHEQMLCLVGKGVTFDSGGISLKPAEKMDRMRGDMGGAACVVGALLAASGLQLPLNIKGLIPLCENMPSSCAVKPGDVVTAMNGKTIQVDNTDAEGRLILADALCYADTFSPQLILDMATLTGAMSVALGSGCTGVFSTSTPLWRHMQEAGVRTGDRMWRMPLLKHYSKQVTESALADVNNVGKYSREGGACTAAAFLKEFVKNENWLHLDIAGVMENKDEVPYLGKGMSGRPTRTVVEFLKRISENSK